MSESLDFARQIVWRLRVLTSFARIFAPAMKSFLVAGYALTVKFECCYLPPPASSPRDAPLLPQHSHVLTHLHHHSPTPTTRWGLRVLFAAAVTGCMGYGPAVDLVHPGRSSDLLLKNGSLVCSTLFFGEESRPDEPAAKCCAHERSGKDEVSPEWRVSLTTGNVCDVHAEYAL